MINPNISINQQQNQKPQLSDAEILQYIQQNPEIIEILKKNPQVAQQFGKNISDIGIGGIQRPLKSNEYEQIKNIDEYLDKEGGLTIEPTPQFVLKITEKTKEKIFLNITSHSIIDQPEEKELVDLQDYTGIRVPMSVGRIREDHDKKKNICKVIDIIINTKVAEDLKKDLGLQDFFQELLKNYLFEKYKLELDGCKLLNYYIVFDYLEFRTLKMRYKGSSIEFQRVKGKKMPKIEKLDETQTEIKKQQEKFEQQAKQNIIQQNQKQLQVPEFECKVQRRDTQEIEYYDGDVLESDVDKLIFEFTMPLLATGKFIIIELHEKELYIWNKNFYEIILKIPLKIDISQVIAQFFTNKRLLIITLKVKNLKETLITNSTNNNQDLEEIEQPKDYNIEIKNPLLLDLV